MMKKMKGVAPVRYPSSYAEFEDQKMMFKHQNLVLDYDDLQKNIQAAKVKLEMMEQKKLTLLAEVRFLRRRHKFLMKNQPSNANHKKHLRHVQNVKDNGRGRNQRTPGTLFQQQAPAFDLNRKENVANGKKTAVRSPVPRFNLNQTDRSQSEKKVNCALVFDLNQNESINEGKESMIQNVSPVLDLNQRLMEEEMQPNSEPVRIEEPKKVLLGVGTDECTKDTGLSIYMNIGDGSGRTGKRKILWQDQVALRV